MAPNKTKRTNRRIYKKDEENTMERTNKNESKMQSFFKEDNPKTLMILNGITAFIWAFVTAMKLHEIVAYNHSSGASLYVTGGLALFYIGLTLGYACKYAKAKKQEI